jgi:hypothetical protein
LRIGHKIYLHDDAEIAETVIAELEHRKNQLNDHLDRTVEELNQQKQRLRRNTQIQIGNQPILNQEQFTIQDQALNMQIRDLEKMRKRFDEDLKTAKANRTSIRKKMDTAKGKRNYTDKSFKLKIYNVFNKYGITPQAYHGGDFVGNRVRKFMQFAVEICAECTALLKEVPDENRRPNGEHGKM